jgi:geranylgeranyl diphosphate synthase type II
MNVFSGSTRREPLNLGTYLSEKRQMIDARLKTWLDAVIADKTRLKSAMAHCLMSGGKRLRPVLCLATAEAVGGDIDADVLEAGCALEMIHTYSLIHDDLPAMDDDVLRRGKPTCHVAFDEATAILAGDALLTLAFEVMADAAGKADASRTGLWIQVIRIIARAAGCQGMVEGQMRDMDAEKQVLGYAQLESLHRLKTGALIHASVTSGALLGKAAPGGSVIEQLGIFAQHIGLAFQITDDILNVEGDSKRMGKAVGTDSARGKSTYASLLGVPAAKTRARQLVETAINALNTLGEGADPLRAIAAYIIERSR